MATTYPSTAPPCATDDVSDGHLLDLFIRHKDEAAFAEIVRRHGRMVLGVCHRVLDNPHDAEDCFQAAFLVLVRKATTIQPREMVGNWLYGVAYRTALEAKKMAARRRNRERKRFDMALPGIANDPDADRWQDMRPLLDEEMNRLPDKYRFVLIACDIEGRTRKDVAHSLALPEGTVASRLARARTMLAKRLTRRNFAISAGMVAILLADNASASCVPASLTDSTTNAAARLAAGKSVTGLINGNALALVNTIVRSMLLAKLKIVSAAMAVLMVLVLGISALMPSANAHKMLDKQPAIPVEAKKAKPVAVGDCVLHVVDLINRRIEALGYDEADGGGMKAYELAVAPDAIIRINGKDGSLADLPIGASINLELQRGPGGVDTAVCIEVGQAPVEGVVEAFNENENSLTIQTVKQPDGKKFDVEKTAWILVDGKKAKFADLKAKMKVALNVSLKKQTVFAIQATGPKVDGILKAIDIDRRTLTFGAKRFDLAADVAVTINGKAGQLAGVRAGMQVTLQMAADADRNQVVAITANGE
jgi:RNA polymerase sigma factor (sigma-70 family)